MTFCGEKTCFYEMHVMRASDCSKTRFLILYLGSKWGLPKKEFFFKKVVVKFRLFLLEKFWRQKKVQQKKSERLATFFFKNDVL